MKKIAVAALICFATVGLIFAHPRKASASPTVTDTLKRLEQDFGDAIKAVDTGKLDQILADDWRSVGYSGKVSSKESFLSYVQSGKSRLESFEYGPMDFKVLGNVAVVQGSHTETRTTDGRASSFKLAWMDVLEKRGDKWVLVRSQTTKLD